VVGISKLKRKEESLGFLLNKWDNQLDNTVEAFNKLFNGKLGHKKDLEVEIGNLYTANGRYITVDGIRIRHMFARSDEDANYNNHIVYDVYDPSKVDVDRYSKPIDIAEEYDISQVTVYQIIRGKASTNRNGLRIKRIDLGEENGTLN
jgi:hypothetical protein